jgi:Tfp pilus assembly protein PilF
MTVNPCARADYLIEGLEHCRKAIQAFSAAIDADPNYLPAYEARAWVYKAAGQHGFAIEDLERISPRSAALTESAD